MLSILIPVFNQVVGPLTKSLLMQGRELGLVFEIVLIDDESREIIQGANRPLALEPEVVYLELKKNVGRAAIRNLLAAKAKFDHLLFIDGDMLPLKNDFLAKYQPFLNREIAVCGGHVYQIKKPARDKILHYTYGRKLEALSAKDRRKWGYKGFKSSNFLISKKVFLGIKFESTIKHYGHEDTLFGMALGACGVPLEHIDNPMIHLGLDTNIQFLEKTQQALKTLYQLENEKAFVFTHLQRWVHALEKTGLSRVFLWLFDQSSNRIYKLLGAGYPFLFLLQYYKLGFYLKIKNLSNEKGASIKR